MTENYEGALNKSVLGWGNRGWPEIVDLILHVCENGALKTHVMYRCNLNSKQIQEYITFLLERELIVANPPDETKKVIYTTTPRGRRFMAAYEELAEIFNMNGSIVER